MINILKSNKFSVFFILIICFIFITDPAAYSKSCLNAVSVWGFNLFPVLFPFFVFTRLIVSFSENKPNFMDKFFNKFYNSPFGSFQTFFLSALSGYPMGAKLICNLYEDKKITQNQAKKMLSFCSISGPMFMIGTVGVSIFCSFKSGVIILISNIVASLINGLIYRGKSEKQLPLNAAYKKQENMLSKCVEDSLNSILMVGAYLVISFLIIDMLKNLQIFEFLCKFLTLFFDVNPEILSSILSGLLEITKGILSINLCNISLTLKTIIASFLIGFGGICILLQSQHFISKIGIKKGCILLQKTTQGLLSMVVSIPLSILFL